MTTPNNHPPPRDPHHDDKDKNNLQAQLEAQAQAQAELQAQLQGQGQGQHQSQHQESENYNKNFNADVNLNGNANLNANVNLNKTEVCVDVKVNADVSASGENDSHTYGIDMGYLSINVSEIDGILNLTPEIINQTINGGGAGTNVLFNLDQVNNLVDNDKMHDVSNAASGGSVSITDVKGEGGDVSIGGSDGKDGKHDGPVHVTGFGGIGGHDDESGSQGVQIGSGNGAGSTNSTLVDASGNVSIDAFTQSIVLGANVLTNSFNMNNAGNDITVTDHGSDHHA